MHGADLCYKFGSRPPDSVYTGVQYQRTAGATVSAGRDRGEGCPAGCERQAPAYRDAAGQYEGKWPLGE